MKFYLKMCGIFLFSIMTALVVYPFLHEISHSVAAILMGAKVYDFQLFPLPYVVCYSDQFSTYEHTVVGIAGLVLPMTFLLFKPKKFCSTVVLYTIKGIVSYAWLLSIISIMCYVWGNIWECEDIIQIIILGGGNVMLWLAICIVAFLCSISIVLKERPIKKIMDYFE